MSFSAEDWPQFDHTAKGHCELMSFAYEHLQPDSKMQSAERFLLQFGEEWDDPHLPEHIERMESRMCFMNCFELVSLNDDLTYCEGFLLQDRFPILIHHAWCLDESERVVEPTVAIDDFETLSYFGVRVADRNAIEGVIDATKTYSILFKPLGHRLIEQICAKTSGNCDG